MTRGNTRSGIPVADRWQFFFCYFPTEAESPRPSWTRGITASPNAWARLGGEASALMLLRPVSARSPTRRRTTTTSGWLSRADMNTKITINGEVRKRPEK